MSRRNDKIQNATTEEPVVKEDSKTVVAEETAEQTLEPVTKKKVEEKEELPKENFEIPTKTEAPIEKPVVEEPKKESKTVTVTCEKLYIRPEPNKKADIGVLTKGTKLLVNEIDGKLPEGWLAVSTTDTPVRTGYVMAEYVK